MNATQQVQLPQTSPPDIGVAAADRWVLHNNMLVHDHDWQFPAITEHHAYLRLKACGGAPQGVIYVAYPWATLIDKLQCWSPDAAAELERFRAFAASLPQAMPKVTVCQHILLPQYLHLFAEAGIDDIFWSHTPHQPTAAMPNSPKAPRLHPFPLYPVQVPQTLTTPRTDAQSEAPRRYLFSFAGAKANPWYLTRVRDWILSDLADDPRGHVLGRDTWHFQRVVYDHQIRHTPGAEQPEDLIDRAAGDHFTQLLCDSTFALCPSGTGPNSIRLWEAIGAGAVPVILSDDYAPPGDLALWQTAAVFCPETREALRDLPDQLAAIARDATGMAARRAALRQLWVLYGPDGFVSDVLALMLAHRNQPDLVSQPLPLPDASEVRTVILTAGLAGQALAGLASDGGSALTPGLEAQMEGLLGSAASLWLLDAKAARARFDPQGAVGQALLLCCTYLPKGHPARDHYDLVTAMAPGFDGADNGGPNLAAPHHLSGQGPLIFTPRDPQVPTPLDRPALRQIIGIRARFTDQPEAADIIITGKALTYDHPWAGFAARRLVMAETPDQLPAACFLPYALVADPLILPRLLTLFGQSCDADAAAVLARWRAAPVPLAQTAPKLPSVPDAASHLARLASLYRQVFAFASVSDLDLLDGLACGALPLCGHAPSALLQSWLPERILTLNADAPPPPGLALAQAYLSARATVLARITAPDAVIAERRQLVTALLARLSCEA